MITRCYLFIHCAIIFDAENMYLRYLMHIFPTANDGAVNKKIRSRDHVVLTVVGSI